jgi:hypothetical protein
MGGVQEGQCETGGVEGGGGVAVGQEEGQGRGRGVKEEDYGGECGVRGRRRGNAD